MKSFTLACLVLSATAAMAQDFPFLLQNQLLNSFNSASSPASKELISFGKCLKNKTRDASLSEGEKSDLEQLVASILDQDGKLTKDSLQIKQAKEACLAGSEVDQSAASDSYKLQKAKTLVNNFIAPVYSCTSVSVEASAAVLIGAGAGAAVYKCQGTDGSIKTYVGPKIIFAVGIGATLTFQKRSKSDNAENNVKGGMFKVMGGAEAKMGLILAKTLDGDGGGIGAGMTYDAFAVPSVRVLGFKKNFDGMQTFLEANKI